MIPGRAPALAGGRRGGEFALSGDENFNAAKRNFTEGKNEKNTNPNLIDFGM
jgi:hypothetical protein